MPGTHTHYCGGQHRPRCRGVLHGLVTFGVILWLLVSPPDLDPATLPVCAAICWTLVWSSSLHLIPYRDKHFESIIERLDKCGIAAVCCATFVTPYLTQSERCRPSFTFVLLTTLLPNLGTALMILANDTRPRVFVGCFVCSISAGVFVATLDTGALVYILQTFSLYGCSMVLFVKRPGGKCAWWGYHEWMHVLVTLSFYLNYTGIRCVSVCVCVWVCV